jgi:hypothetical protein
MVVCAVCSTEFTAQRRTRRYCSEACRQRAKRARERAAEWPHLLPEERCTWCAGPLFPEDPSLALKGKSRWTHRRKYCSAECRNAARRFRYRVAQADEDSPYRVTGPPASDPDALAQPVPCWRSAEWHETACVVLALMGNGWVLARPPDPPEFSEGELTWTPADAFPAEWEPVDLATAREFAASHHSGPSPGEAREDRELSVRKQGIPASPDTAPDSGPVQDSSPPVTPGSRWPSDQPTAASRPTTTSSGKISES